MIKRVITGGCSFSDAFCEQLWIYKLQNKVQSLYPNVSFRHTGFGGQGQELIQKKMSLALLEELVNYKPEEILVLPMWSGTERKAFYVDNKDYIEDIIQEWPKRGLSWNLQFGDLYNKSDPKTTKVIDSGSWEHGTRLTDYNTEGGWYVCNYVMPDSKLSIEYFNTASTIIGFATVSLENIIFLHNLCKLKGVKIYHSFYRSYVYDDIFQNKDHLNLNYLFNMWDHDTIVSTTGIYEHLRPITDNFQQWDMGGLFKHNVFKFGPYTDETKQYFESDNWHPNSLGNQKWVDEVLFPVLQSKGIF
jgi:hypothetical protein